MARQRAERAAAVKQLAATGRATEADFKAIPGRTAPTAAEQEELATLAVRTAARDYRPKNEAQRQAAEHVAAGAPIVFLLGAAGTGKTFSAMAAAVQAMAAERRVVVTRPTVPCGNEGLGFLKGDLQEKLHPWLIPFESCLDVLVGESNTGRVLARFDTQTIAHIRGRTLRNCLAVMTEAQNLTLAQLEAYLTRRGEGATLLIDGSPTQTDLPEGSRLEVVAEECVKAGAGVVVRYTTDMQQRSETVNQVIAAFAAVRARLKGR